MVSINGRSKRASIAILLGGVVVLSACVNKDYVRKQLGTLDPAIRDINNSVKENTERIDAADKRSQQAMTAAQAADQKATQANAAAQAAQEAARAADRTNESANQALQVANTRISTV